MKVLVGAVLWALVLGAVWEKVDVYRTGYAIEQLKLKKQQVKHEQRRLELEWATVTSPGHIERVAATRLGMLRPRTDQVVLVGAGRQPEQAGIVRVAHQR